jgi:hypothetical protein
MSDLTFEITELDREPEVLPPEEYRAEMERSAQNWANILGGVATVGFPDGAKQFRPVVAPPHPDEPQRA